MNALLNLLREPFKHSLNTMVKVNFTGKTLNFRINEVYNFLLVFI